MAELPPTQRLSVEGYLAAEDGAECRHEYIDGDLYAMTGASDRHGLIVGNLYARLRTLLRGSPCQLFSNDMKVRLRIAEQDIFYYPDLLLSCDPRDRETYYRGRPCLLIEVLSESTARIDRREKLFAYQTLPSLQEYLLIEQDVRAVEIHRRVRGWAGERVTDGGVHLDCLEIDVPLDAIYEDVPLDR
jgi:Uma2 family endonuclease